MKTQNKDIESPSKAKVEREKGTSSKVVVKNPEEKKVKVVPVAKSSINNEKVVKPTEVKIVKSNPAKVNKPVKP